MRTEVVVVLNAHARSLPVPASQVGPLLDRLGGPDDALWPSPAWPPMVLDGQLAVGVTGGHGPVRYQITRYDPGRLVEFTFTPDAGLSAPHTLSIEPSGADSCLLRHVLKGRLVGSMLLAWPLVVRWVHDAVAEDLMDRAEAALEVGPARPAQWSPMVRLLRWATRPRARATAVVASPLIDEELPEVDWADAFAVDCPTTTSMDPQEWADAVFRDPPAWVKLLLVTRQSLVGFIGIDRAAPSTFDTRRRTRDEVLLGVDERHLSVRMSLRRLPDRAVLTTAVRANNHPGRVYSAIVRRAHPAVVRAMLTRAARTLTGLTGTSRPDTVLAQR